MPSFVYEEPLPSDAKGKSALARMIQQQRQQDGAPTSVATIPYPAPVVTEAPRLSLFQRLKSSVMNALPIDGIPSWLSTSALFSLMGVTVALLIALIIDRFVFVSDIDASVGQFIYCVNGECHGNDGHVELLSFLSTSHLMAARAFMVAAFVVATLACVITGLWLIKATALRSSLVLAAHVVMLLCLLINVSLWASMKPAGASYMASYDLVVLAFVGTAFSTMIWAYCEHRRRRTADHNVVSSYHTDVDIDHGIDDTVRPVRLTDTIREISRSGTSTAHVYTIEQMTEFEELEEKETALTHHTTAWRDDKKSADAEEIITLTSFLDTANDQEVVPSSSAWKPLHLTVKTGEDLTHNAEFMRQLAHSIAKLNKAVDVGTVEVHHEDDHPHNVFDFGQLTMHAAVTIDDETCFDSAQSETSSLNESPHSSRISMYSSTEHDAECTCSPEHHQEILEHMVERVTINV